MNWNRIEITTMLGALCFAVCLWILALSYGPALARKIFTAYYEAKLAFLRKSLGDGVLRSEPPNENNLTEEISRRRR